MKLNAILQCILNLFHDLFHGDRWFKTCNKLPLPIKEKFCKIPFNLPVLFIVLIHLLCDCAHSKSHRAHTETIELGNLADPLKQRISLFTPDIYLGKLGKGDAEPAVQKEWISSSVPGA